MSFFFVRSPTKTFLYKSLTFGLRKKKMTQIYCKREKKKRQIKYHQKKERKKKSGQLKSDLKNSINFLQQAVQLTLFYARLD